MFSLRLPIPIASTITPHLKTNKPSPCSYSRSQTHRFLSQPLIKVTEIGGTISPNMALQDDGTSNAGDSPEPQPEPMPKELQVELMPKHVAMIMDGNGRWAKLRGMPILTGHQAGARTLRRLVRLCCNWGIRVVTVFVFSTENFMRSSTEVDFMMSQTERTMASHIDILQRHGIRLSVIGDSSKLPSSLQRMINHAEESTKDNSRLHLIMAIGYGGKYDVVQACKSVAKKVKDGLVQLEDINENIIQQELETNCTEFPNPDLLIRTSGELRVSNFMLWQLAYTELYFSRKLWPDFGKDEFVEALSSFQQRQRRFGGRQS